MGGGFNYILKSGELGYDINENILKIGDGVNSWNKLEPVNKKAFFSELETRLVNIENTNTEQDKAINKKYTKPFDGIPAEDLAVDAIPHPLYLMLINTVDMGTEVRYQFPISTLIPSFPIPITGDMILFCTTFATYIGSILNVSDTAVDVKVEASIKTALPKFNVSGTVLNIITRQ